MAEAVASAGADDREAAVASRRHLTARVLIYGLLTFFALIYIIPLIVVVLNSFRESTEFARNGLIAFPEQFQINSWIARSG
jgi:glucose/mannose transport system permease protein